MDHLDSQRAKEFADPLHICLTWQEANTVSYNYLQDQLTAPIAIIRADMGGGERTPNCYYYNLCGMCGHAACEQDS